AAVRKKRRRTRPTTSTSSSASSVSTQAGGSQTVTGTDVLCPSAALVRTASVAIRRPDLSARISGGAETAPRRTLTLTASIVPPSGPKRMGEAREDDPANLPPGCDRYAGAR